MKIEKKNEDYLEWTKNVLAEFEMKKWRDEYIPIVRQELPKIVETLHKTGSLDEIQMELRNFMDILWKDSYDYF